MPKPKRHLAASWEDSGLSLMAYVLGNAGTPIVQSEFGDIAYAVFERQSEVKPSTPLAASAVVFDTPETSDSRWPYDSGYNFAFVVPADALQQGGQILTVVVTFTPAAGEKFHAVWDIDVMELRRS